MIEIIKTKLWNILKDKEVSLAMLYDREGNILWFRGREISGKNINTGEGFCKSYILESLRSGEGIDEENVIIKSSAKVLSESAHRLLVKSVVIQPINKDLFLYIDSGTKESFNETEHGIFRTLGELLGDTINQIEKSETGEGGITGKSEEIKKIREKTLKYSLEEDPVLLLGETGVGKSHIAELLHKYSGRPGKFVVVNTPTVQENLFESVMFGHIKGAFTDAKFDKKGAVAEAERGTLFIDEISEIPVFLQAKLLRVLQEEEVRPVGSDKPLKTNVRVISASSTLLRDMVEGHKFREDLYYRLHVYPIFIPELRERQTDIPLLANHFLHRFARQQKKKAQSFHEELLDYMKQRAWPGNIRELENFVERIVAVTPPEPAIIESSFLPPDIKKELAIFKQESESQVNSESIKDQLHHFEAQIIRNALIACDWNQSQAARQLKTSESNIRYKIKQLNITRE